LRSENLAAQASLRPLSECTWSSIRHRAGEYSQWYALITGCADTRPLMIFLQKILRYILCYIAAAVPLATAVQTWSCRDTWGPGHDRLKRAHGFFGRTFGHYPKPIRPRQCRIAMCRHVVFGVCNPGNQPATEGVNDRNIAVATDPGFGRYCNQRSPRQRSILCFWQEFQGGG
jgi:hypothetical protein